MSTFTGIRFRSEFRLLRCKCHTEYREQEIKIVEIEGCRQCGFRWIHPMHPKIYLYIRLLKTTEYRKLTLLCQVWLDVFPKINEAYPSDGVSCRFYDLLDDIQKLYSQAHSEDKYQDGYTAIGQKDIPKDLEEKNKNANDWFRRCFKFATSEEDLLVRLLSKKEVSKENVPTLTGTQLDLF